MTIIQLQIQECLKPIMDILDAEAIKIINNLLKRLLPLKKIVPLKLDNEFISSGIGFQGNAGTVSIASYDNALSEFVEEENLALIKKNQFNSFAENRLYCEGTFGCLLELLIQYRYIETEKTIIFTTADVCSWRSGQASIEQEDLLSVYGEKRTVVTTIIYDAGFIAFTFEDNIRKKK